LEGSTANAEPVYIQVQKHLSSKYQQSLFPTPAPAAIFSVSQFGQPASPLVPSLDKTNGETAKIKDRKANAYKPKPWRDFC
jgi:hypothetical protein